MDTESQTVICTKCYWTHFAVTRAYAENQVKEFNEYYNTLSKDQQDSYYGGKASTLGLYERCFCCGHNEFKPGSTAPVGSTIGPVIYE